MLGKRGRAAKSEKAPSGRNPVKETDYRQYRLNCREFVVYAGKTLLITVAVAWLFYRRLGGMLVILVIAPVLWVTDKRKKKKKRQEELRNQFKECIGMVTTSMYAGYSVENAFRAAEKELVSLAGAEADMCRELHVINQKIGLNMPIEGLLKNLAERSGVEEIGSFGQVFAYAKRNGSDFSRILRDTAGRITEKAELERELQTLTAEKQLEQKIMNVVPLGILCFINVTSPDFLQTLYEGTAGTIVMSGCLLAYAGAYALSAKIVDIKI